MDDAVIGRTVTLVVARHDEEERHDTQRGARSHDRRHTGSVVGTGPSAPVHLGRAWSRERERRAPSTTTRYAIPAATPAPVGTLAPGARGDETSTATVAAGKTRRAVAAPYR